MIKLVLKDYEYEILRNALCDKMHTLEDVEEKEKYNTLWHELITQDLMQSEELPYDVHRLLEEVIETEIKPYYPEEVVAELTALERYNRILDQKKLTVQRKYK